MQINRSFRYADNQCQTHNWVTCVKHCLDIFGFSVVWLNGGVGNEKVFLRAFKQRMIDCYTQDWSSKRFSSDKYATYHSLKSLLQPDKYLLDITIAKFRSAFVRFRLGVSDLNVNKRFGSESNYCPLCASRTEDALHFLLKCLAYQELRDKYIPKYCTNMHETIPLTFFVQNENMSIIRSLAMFIYDALKKREDTATTVTQV